MFRNISVHVTVSQPTTIYCRLSVSVCKTQTLGFSLRIILILGCRTEPQQQHVCLGQSFTDSYEGNCLHRAGTLNRDAAVRRSCNEGKPREANGANGCADPGRPVAKAMMLRFLSFGDERSREGSYTILGEIDEEGMSETITRVDSGIIAPSAARNTSQGRPEERPVIARTFSEILDGQPFVRQDHFSKNLCSQRIISDPLEVGR